jgi:hypothetical protein
LDISNLNEVTEVLNSFGKMTQTAYEKSSKAAFQYARDFINNSNLIEQNKNLFLLKNNKE